MEHSLAIELAKRPSTVCRADGSPAKGAATLTASFFGGEDGGVLFADSRKVKVV